MNALSHSAPAVCVVIVAYNFEPWIRQCLSSIAQSTLRATVLVIDNASEDNTCEIIRKEYPDVLLTENGENLGFGRANNIGLRYAVNNGFEYVFLLNQDAWLEADALEKLVGAAAAHPCFGILSPVHLNGEGNAPDFGFARYTGLRTLSDRESLLPQVVEYSFINAAMWLLPVSVLKESGGFAPIFAHYGEDVNLSQRIRKRGYKVGVVKAATGFHDRQRREASDEKYFYSEFVYLLTEAVNPLYRRPRAFAYSVLAAAKKALTALLAGRGKAAARYAAIACRLLRKTPQIEATRKTTALPGPHFID